MKSFFEKNAHMCLRQLPLFLMLVAYAVLPAFLGWYNCKTILALVVPQTVLPSLLLCMVADRRRWLWWTVFTFASLLWLVETECWFCQDQRMNSRIAMIIAQSNPDESGEYIGLMLPRILKGLGAWAVCVAFFYICCRLWRRHSERIAGRLLARRGGAAAMAAAGALLSLSVIYSPAAVFTAIHSGDSSYPQRIARPKKFSNMCTWIFYAYALSDTFDNPCLKEIPVLKATIESARVDAGNAMDSLSVVYVIGESFSRSRSSLYGYPFPTNPLMAREVADSSLILYTNVISLSHYTTDVYKCMMSTYDPQHGDAFERYPMFPALMKRAGYRVANYDNQSLVSTAAADLITNYFFSDKAICDLCFDTYNDSLAEYDGGFVDRYPPLDGDSLTKCLTIYHLMGQHTSYRERYPEGFRHFTTDDYRIFDGLSDRGASAMAEFDNATRYNDYVLHEIIGRLRDKTAIMIYAPDHGEVVCDYDEQIGRQPEMPLPSIRLCYEVPAMIWMSDSFRHKYPDIAAALVRNSGKAIYNSDLPHTILDIAGIETVTFNPAVSLLRDGPGRTHRHVWMGDTDYDGSRDEIHRRKMRYE